MADPFQRSPVEEAFRALRAGDAPGAEAICRQALKRDKRDVNAWRVLGQALFEQRQLDEAGECFRKCIALAPREAAFHYLLARVAEGRAQPKEALARCDEALRLNPVFTSAALLKASIHERRAEYDKARAVVEPFFHGPVAPAGGAEEVAMATLLVRLQHRAGRNAEAISLGEQVLARGDVSPGARQTLLYLLGKIHDRAGDYAAAFRACTEANQITARPFDPAEFEREVDRMIEAFSPEKFAAYPKSRHASELPVIIAGMPRSGTTLIEQIIDAHPKAHGAGEIGGIDLFSDFPEYPQWLAGLKQEEIDAISKSGLDQLAQIAGRGALRVVNKSLWNYRLLGLLALMYPGARVIHSRRDPMDTCLSCYLEHLLTSRHPYSTDLYNLGVVHRQCERLMEHWRTTLGLKFMTVQYEELVGDQERVSREMIEFCGLEWDDRCLRSHESGRMVMTLSYDQVNRPVYTSSIGRWRNYEGFLGELGRGLGEGTGDSRQ